MACSSSVKSGTGSPTIQHLPKYKDFLFDGTVTLCARADGKKIEIHKALLGSISPALSKQANKDTELGIKDEREEVLTLFTEWAYTGDYDRKHDTPPANTGNPKAPKDNPWPSLRKHLELRVFSERFYIPTLKELAESKFHTEIHPLDSKSKRDGPGLVTVIGYAYSHLGCWDPIIAFLAQYAAWRLDLLRGTPEFNALILTKPDFSKDLLMRLSASKIKPMTPQKHLTQNTQTYSQHQTGW